MMQNFRPSHPAGAATDRRIQAPRGAVVEAGGRAVWRAAQAAGNAADGVTISISAGLDSVTYQHGAACITLPEPRVLVDRPRLASRVAGADAILGVLDDGPRTYCLDTTSVLLSVEEQRRIWGPSIDTLILIRALSQRNYGRALEVGSGCGFLTLWLVGGGYAETAFGIDIDDSAVRCAQRNADRLGLRSRCRFKVESFSQRRLRGFDLVVCNPPYLPVPPCMETSRLASAYAGTALLNDVLEGCRSVLAADGEAFLVMSSASYLDQGLARQIAALQVNAHAERVVQHAVPMKVNDVTREARWIQYLLAAGGLVERPGDDYRYWHRVDVWRLRR